jgi:pimeloyl-ACP methyl ester carboxylesterase
MPTREAPMFFPAGGETLFGVLTVAEGGSSTARGIVVTVSGGGTPLSTSVNDMWVRLGRRLAGSGVSAFRFDYHGVGESTGETGRFDLASPFAVDLLGAVEHLATFDLGPVALVGSCFGARTALSAASRIEHLAGMVLLCPPVRDFEMGEKTTTRVAQTPMTELIRRAARPSVIRGLFARDRRRAYKRYVSAKFGALRDPDERARLSNGQGRASASFLTSLEDLARRSIPTLIVYGEEDDLLEDYVRAQPLLERVLSLPSARVEHRRVEGSIHGCTTIESQDTVMDLVQEWVVRVHVENPASLTRETEPS